MDYPTEVKTDENGYSKLEIVSNETGKASAFEVSGTASDELKLNDQQTDAQNLKYELNDKAGESESNTLKLEQGKLNIQVTATNETAETFDVQASSKTLVSTLKDFASSFNQFVTDNQNSSNPMTKSIVKQLTNTVGKSLEKLGVDGFEMNAEGKIDFNEAAVAKDVEGKTDKIKNELTRFDSFAASVTRKADQVLKMPLSEVTPDFTSKNMNIKAYMYNYNAQSALNNLNQLGKSGGIMDILI